MCRVINKFLDNYLGDEVVVKKTKWNYRVCYNLCAKNGTTIVSFWLSKNQDFVLSRNIELCKFISSWFGIPEDDAMRKIRDWFGDKHNINKMSDLNRFIY
jgi:hypothetical protein